MVKKKSAVRREEIIDIATRLFKQKGYTATTMREIAEHVGIEAASIYNHIKSKDELLSNICFRIADEYISQLTYIETQFQSPIEKLRELIRLHIRMVFRDINGISVANNEWKHLPEAALLKFKAVRKDYENRFMAIIDAGIIAGEVQPVNTSIALFTILSATRWVELWYKPDRDMPPQILEETILAILMTGLQKK